MAPVEGSPGVFAVVVHLPPGYHQYKFIVDGKWRHDETAPFMPDPLGNVNNWLFVRRIDPSPSAVPFDQQQLLAVQQQQQQAAAAVAVAAQQQQQQQLLVQTQLAPQPVVGHTPTPTGSVLTGPLPTTPSQGDVDMANAEAVVAPIVIHNPKEPEYTRKKIADFLHSHTAYELIPESGKVVILDMDLPVRQAFHALQEQGIASAPLWDTDASTINGVISASDFINILKRLRHSVSAGGNPMSEAEMDAHTIRGLREEVTMEGRDPKPLVYVRPDDDLAKVVGTLFQNKCSMAPIMSTDPGGSEIPDVLHLATLSAVLACLMRHFRASLASLPLLAQPLGSLPLGTWSPDAGVAHADVLPDSKDRRQWRKLQPLHTVTANTPLTQALGLLLEAGVSALPVVDDKRGLLDVYARADITALAKGNAYNRLQWEDVTVGQALAMASSSSTWQPGVMPPGAPPGMGGLSAELQAHGQHPGQAIMAQMQAAIDSTLHAGPGPGSKSTRVYVCSKDDSLRTVVERLAIPGVRRLVVIHPETRRVEGVISLSDVAAYLFL
eukprot:CAMPEP_0202856964 /NCGR_PEP_ID=MMETSP1391-20130828/74_1 /ASSEMBLY_ACC=CAM_ASM_000867 /TAXON_ID=1034604 /ORGANISM="Chlamydomonas leiostraca, Strain SAG 11-49" /LENGTH=551 /DNA_ID=CAMNT_0049535697 /DNA_START=328 /DNA_END=1983 /DNA_ORIENTATION=+